MRVSEYMDLSPDIWQSWKSVKHFWRRKFLKILKFKKNFIIPWICQDTVKLKLCIPHVLGPRIDGSLLRLSSYAGKQTGATIAMCQCCLRNASAPAAWRSTCRRVSVQQSVHSGQIMVHTVLKQAEESACIHIERIAKAPYGAKKNKWQRIVAAWYSLSQF